jgi:hypothetical protein
MPTESEASLRLITSLARRMLAIPGIPATRAAHARLMRPVWLRNALPPSASQPIHGHPLRGRSDQTGQS